MTPDLYPACIFKAVRIELEESRAVIEQAHWGQLGSIKVQGRLYVQESWAVIGK